MRLTIHFQLLPRLRIREIHFPLFLYGTVFKISTGKTLTFSPLYMTCCGFINLFTVGLCFAGLRKTSWAVTTASTYSDQTVVTDIRRHINEKWTKHTQKKNNKRCGNALDLYSEDIHFKSRPGQYPD
jgi:hypothetical protein